jgi:hypothetical protein
MRPGWKVLVERQGKASGMECGAQTKPIGLKPNIREDPNDVIGLSREYRLAYQTDI